MHTVFGAFDDPQAAQRAQQRLLAAGFAQERVHLQAARVHGEDPHEPQNQSVLASLGGFWADLVQTNNVHEQMLAEAVRGGQTLVGVDAATEPLARQARRLLRECGALRLDEQDDGSRLPDPPQPWHAADEGRQPIGTHSFTGSGASVGLPSRERATAASGEPRAGAADLLGPKPGDPDGR